jgi:hypothetical protein
MEERLENIDLIFRDELNGYSPEVPEGMWERIAVNITPQKKRAIIPLFWKIAASVAFILTTGSLATYILSSKSTADTTAEINITNKVNQGETQSQPEAASENTASYIKANEVKLNGSIKSKFSGNHSEQQIIAEAIQNINVGNALNNEPIQNEDAIEEPTVLVDNLNYITENQSIDLQGVDTLISPEIIQPEKEINTQELAANNLVFEEYQEEKSNTKWLIGGQAGPQYTYRNLTSEYQTDMIDGINRTELGVVAYAGGINIEVQPKRRFSIQSGVYYSKIGTEQVAIQSSNSLNNNQFTHNPEDYGVNNSTSSVAYRFPNSSVTFEQKSNTSATSTIKQPTPVNNTVSNIDKDNPVPEYLFTRYQEYLEVPIVAKFIIVDRKFGVNVLGGVSSNFLVNNYNVSDNSDLEKNYVTENVNIVNLSSTLGIGLNYDISSRINMSIEPQFKYFLSKQINTDKYDIHPYTIGIFTGVKYLF